MATSGVKTVVFNGGDVVDGGADGVDLLHPATEHGGVGLGEEPVDGGDHADELFLGDFHAAADALVDGAIVGGGEIDEVFAAEEEAGVLRAADAFAAGEADKVEAHAGELPEVFDGRHVGGGVVVRRGRLWSWQRRIHSSRPMTPGCPAWSDSAELKKLDMTVLSETVRLKSSGVTTSRRVMPQSCHGVVVLVAVGLLDDDLVFGGGVVAGDDAGGDVLCPRSCWPWRRRRRWQG